MTSFALPTPPPASAAAPQWMRHVLRAAAVYNLLWGAFAVLFPRALFDWLGMVQPNYPQFWQCIGMIVGVYGIGYAIAASDPARHWPIVLVGFLGKVAGPLGMVQALWEGAFPWTFALNCLTNDLVWWIPFALILRFAWQAQDSVPSDFPSEAELLAGARTVSGESLAELSHRSPLLVVFLRHAGCTFCREALADLSQKRAQIEAGGTRFALVHMGDPDEFAAFAAGYGLGDVPAISDPQRILYRGIGLRRGSFAQLLGPAVWWRGARAFFAGHGVGALKGDGAQMPGVFVLEKGRVVRRFLHRNAAERPDYPGLCTLPHTR
jgi:peroxiredoxin